MMRSVCERTEARWMPSRHRRALFRLAALLRLRVARPSTDPGLLLMIDRDQSQFENYAMSVWFTLTLTCFVAATFFSAWPMALALLVSFPLAIAISQATIVLCALLIAPLFPRNRIAPVSIGTMLLVIAPAAYYARAATWIRFVAWHVLVLLALNALAAVIVFFLRAPIERIERAYEETGGPASAS